MKLITNQETITTADVEDLDKKFIGMSGRTNDDVQVWLFLIEVQRNLFQACIIEHNGIHFYSDIQFKLEDAGNVIDDCELYCFDHYSDLIKWVIE